MSDNKSNTASLVKNLWTQWEGELHKKNGKTTNKYDREGSICRKTAFCFESECILKSNVRKPSQARHKLSVSTPESNQKTQFGHKTRPKNWDYCERLSEEVTVPKWSCERFCITQKLLTCKLNDMVPAFIDNFQDALKSRGEFS